MAPPLAPTVAPVFESYPPAIRRKLMSLRRLVFETARATAGAGALSETLKWNEPSYRNPGGTPIRLGWKASSPGRFAMYFHCQTDLISRFRERFSEELEFEGNRAIVFDASARVPTEVVALCIQAALTYHQDKKRGAG